jgi:hypothetical protein
VLEPSLWMRSTDWVEMRAATIVPSCSMSKSSTSAKIGPLRRAVIAPGRSSGAAASSVRDGFEIHSSPR